MDGKGGSGKKVSSLPFVSDRLAAVLWGRKKEKQVLWMQKALFKRVIE